MTAQSSWKLSTVILADDGSENALAATKMLGEIPLAKDISLTVLRAFPSTQSAEVYALEDNLQQTCKILQLAGYTPKPELVLGSPAEKIIEFSLTHHPQLVVLGARGLRATFGILLGGVAQQVVEYACCPVLIVRAPYQSLKRILLVTDGSAYSDEAINYLSGFPLPAGVEIVAVHVLPPSPPYIPIEPGYIGPPISQPLPVDEATLEQRKAADQAGWDLLAKTEKELAKPGYKTTSELLHGDAATEIIDYVKDHNIDLIVTGSRGLSQMKAWLLGSVSRKLVHYSNCSVLVVRKPESPE